MGKALIIPNISFALSNLGLVAFSDEEYIEPIRDYSQEYFTIEPLEDGTIEFNKYALGVYKYSTNNGQTWVTYNGEQIDVLVGTNILIKATRNNTWCNSTNIESTDKFIISTVNYNVYGNPLSLYYEDNFTNIDTLNYDYMFARLFCNDIYIIDASNLVLNETTITHNCYRDMFYGCENLIHGPLELPALTMKQNCYRAMFYGCISLTEAPELLATTLATNCYYNMFQDCVSLETSPELPATTLAGSCYQGMFEGCTSLTEAPELSATTLANGCYMSMFKNCTLLETSPELPALILVNSCYREMFSGCSSLTEAPELPATTLAQNCYMYMFKDCTSLIEAPELLATTLANSCYQGMFYGCIDLTESVELPATTLTNYCYKEMFNGCTSIEEALEISATTIAQNCCENMFNGCTSLETTQEILFATTLANSCYQGMFYGCNQLEKAPKLPATILAQDCYNSMFSLCSSLLEAPELPAITLAIKCYKSMFHGCSSLETSPELPALILVNNCYQNMFSYCANLNYVKCLATNISATNCISSWLSSCSSIGKFVKNDNMNDWPTGNSGIPNNWTIDNSYDTKYLTIESLENNNIITFNTTNNDFVNTIYISTDNGINWAPKTIENSSITLATLDEGETLLIKGYNLAYAISSNNTINYNHFDSSGEINVYGNIMSLIYGSQFYNKFELSDTNTFYGLFINCDIINAENLILPATTLINGCYANMFKGCVSLETSPELPAIILSNECYVSMFEGCTSLTEAPELLAITLTSGCYNMMFYGCTNLNYIKCLAINISATNCLNNWVYGVSNAGTFAKNSIMNSWPTGSSGVPNGWEFYYNYSSDYFTIESLENNNIITASKNNSGKSPTIYYSLDNGETWNNQTLSSGTITFGTINTGEKIIFKCTISNWATDWNKYNKFNGSKNFKVYGNIMSLLNGDNFVANSEFDQNSTFNLTGLFYESTNLIDASDLILPALTLKTSCYNGIFRGCSNLVYGPKLLPALDVPKDGYSSMFEGCVKLVEGPEIIATSVSGDAALNRMFCANRTSSSNTPLTKSPILRITNPSSYANVYQQLFCGHANITEVTILAQGTNLSFTNWLANTNAIGIIKKLSATTLTTGSSGVPSGWTTETYIEN